MKKLVKINAKNVNSHFGYVIDECGGASLIKVPCKADWMGCLEQKNCIIIGSAYISEVNA